MLSILIPNYNYNVFPLVNALYSQCCNLDNFEIIVFDDASTISYPENASINSFKNCTYKVLTKNVGRSEIRNQLAANANYNWILFLDADVIPVNANFIFNYIEAIKLNFDVYFGGLAYQKNRPDKQNQLRWYYGKKREALSLENRVKCKPNDFFCSNLLIKKEVFNKIKFDNNLKKYGYEDLVFNKHVIDKGFTICQIDNPVYHLNIEENVVFLNKTQSAILNLNSLIKSGLIDKKEVRIVHFAVNLNSIFLKKIFITIKLDEILKKMVLLFPSKIWLFDCFRVIYFIKIN